MIEVEAYCSTLLDGDPRMTGSVSSRWSHRRLRPCLALAALAGMLVVSGCSSPPPKVRSPEPVTLRLGYVTELADAPALAGLQMGFIGSGASDVNVDAVPF